MKLFEQRIDGETLYDGKIVKLYRDRVRLENGAETYREVIDHPGGVAVLALDAEDNVYLVRQFRYPTGQVLLELPAGKLEAGEDPAVCAARELEEETGYRAGKWTCLGQFFPSPGYIAEVLHVYLARELEFAGQHLDRDEFLSVEKMPLRAALELCMDGEIRDAKTLIGLLKYDRMRAH